LLELWEIARENHWGKLILLSQSQRPLRRVKAGESLIAWSWAWLVAGTPASVVRQWEVPPEASSSLIPNLISPAPTNARARTIHSSSQTLRQAVIKLLQSQTPCHPGSWAAYQWMGWE
jgi:CHAT domain-containing protein